MRHGGEGEEELKDMLSFLTQVSGCVVEWGRRNVQCGHPGGAVQNGVGRVDPELRRAWLSVSPAT